MRSTCSLYIDAGYLLASAATRVTGTSLRSGIHVTYSTLISSLVDTAEVRSGLPVLRVYWYDSARNGIPDVQQERIGELPKVKLRLGRFGVNGEQKKASTCASVWTWWPTPATEPRMCSSSSPATTT